MKKAYKKPAVMRRTSRLFCNDVNVGKAVVVRDFLHQCHDVTPYFVDLFWQRQDFSAALADLATVGLNVGQSPGSHVYVPATRVR